MKCFYLQDKYFAVIINFFPVQLVGSLNCEVSEATDDESDSALDHTVEAVSFCPHLPNIAVTATLAGFVTLWDVSSKASSTAQTAGIIVELHNDIRFICAILRLFYEGPAGQV